MKKGLVIGLLALSTLMIHAQETPFEGTMVLKVLNSYSKAYVGMNPQYYSGSDTVIVRFKGDAVHEHFKVSGIHKVYYNDMLYYYSENTKKGFMLPIRSANVERIKEVYETNEERSFLGKPCTTQKTLILLNNNTIEIDCWLTEDTYRFSKPALQVLYTDLCSRMSMDFGDKICMKMSLSNYNTGNLDTFTKMAKNMSNKEQRKVLWGSEDKELTEISMSQIFEVMSITPQTVDDNQFAPPADINIEEVPLGLDATPAFDREQMKAVLLANPSYRKKVEKGKIDIEAKIDELEARVKATLPKVMLDEESILKSAAMLGEDKAEAMKRTLEEAKAFGSTPEEVAYNMQYFIQEKTLLMQNKTYLNEHHQISQESVQPIAYDLDDEWDF